MVCMLAPPRTLRVRRLAYCIGIVQKAHVTREEHVGSNTICVLSQASEDQVKRVGIAAPQRVRGSSRAPSEGGPRRRNSLSGVPTERGLNSRNSVRGGGLLGCPPVPETAQKPWDPKRWGPGRADAWCLTAEAGWLGSSQHGDLESRIV